MGDKIYIKKRGILFKKLCKYINKKGFGFIDDSCSYRNRTYY